MVHSQERCQAGLGATVLGATVLGATVFGATVRGEKAQLAAQAPVRQTGATGTVRFLKD